jgi:tetratricopeptide (TPR) repeat protein
MPSASRNYELRRSTPTQLQNCYNSSRESQSWGQPMTRNGLYVLAGALMFATSALHASRTGAQTQQQIDWCNNDNNVFSVDQRLSGCTALVKSERASAQDRAAGYGNRCWAYSDKGDPDRAITDCNEAIRLDPKLANAYLNRGKAYSDKDDFDRAIADYDQAIKLNPKSSMAYNNLCDAYLDKGDNDRAITDCDEAIRLDPKFAVAYRNRGNAYRYKGEIASAVADYNQAIELNPKFFQAYLARGLLSLDAGDLPKALADINQASALNPKDPYTALWLDIVNTRSKLPSRLAEATAQIDMTKWPAPVIRLYLGQMTPEAVLAAAAHRDASKQKSQVCEANFFSGELALQQGSKDEATRLFRIAEEGCPKDSFQLIAANDELKALGAQP